MVMKNFLIGLSKFVLGIILAMLIMSLAGLSMVRYFMTRMVEPPDRPSYENDLPEDQRPVAQSPTTAAAAHPKQPMRAQRQRQSWSRNEMKILRVATQLLLLQT